jgi:hypothetical protein
MNTHPISENTVPLSEPEVHASHLLPWVHKVLTDTHAGNLES